MINYFGMHLVVPKCYDNLMQTHAYSPFYPNGRIPLFLLFPWFEKKIPPSSYLLISSCLSTAGQFLNKM